MIGIIFIIIYFAIVTVLAVTCFLKERKSKRKTDPTDLLFYGYSVTALAVLTFLFFWLLSINEGLKETSTECRQKIEETEQKMVKIGNRNLELEKMPKIVESVKREQRQCLNRNETIREEIKKESKEWEEKEKELKDRITELESSLEKTKGNFQETQPELAIQ